MKRFEWIKTIQLVIYFILTVAALVTIFGDDSLYQTIASDPHVRLLCGILWLMMGLSFVFMFLDFGSYTDLKLICYVFKPKQIFFCRGKFSLSFDFSVAVL